DEIGLLELAERETNGGRGALAVSSFRKAHGRKNVFYALAKGIAAAHGAALHASRSHTSSWLDVPFKFHAAFEARIVDEVFLITMLNFTQMLFHFCHNLLAR